MSPIPRPRCASEIGIPNPGVFAAVGTSQRGYSCTRQHSPYRYFQVRSTLVGIPTHTDTKYPGTEEFTFTVLCGFVPLLLMKIPIHQTHVKICP
eukprot:619315-Rhodomonas_salina.1